MGETRAKGLQIMKEATLEVGEKEKSHKAEGGMTLTSRDHYSLNQ